MKYADDLYKYAKGFIYPYSIYWKRNFETFPIKDWLIQSAVDEYVTENCMSLGRILYAKPSDDKLWTSLNNSQLRAGYLNFRTNKSSHFNIILNEDFENLNKSIQRQIFRKYQGLVCIIIIFFNTWMQRYELTILLLLFWPFHKNPKWFFVRKFNVLMNLLHFCVKLYIVTQNKVLTVTHIHTPTLYAWLPINLQN